MKPDQIESGSNAGYKPQTWTICLQFTDRGDTVMTLSHGMQYISRSQIEMV